MEHPVHTCWKNSVLIKNVSNLCEQIMSFIFTWDRLCSKACLSLSSSGEFGSAGIQMTWAYLYFLGELRAELDSYYFVLSIPCLAQS